MKPPTPETVRAFRSLLGLNQWGLAKLLDVSQAGISHAEQGRNPFPKKALPAFTLLMRGYPTSDATGNQLAKARERLGFTLGEFAPRLSLTPPTSKPWKRGEEPIPWVSVMLLSTLEKAAGFQQTFTPSDTLATNLQALTL